MMKCLLTELGWAGREILCSRSGRTDLSAHSPYVLTLSQIFSRLAFSLISKSTYYFIRQVLKCFPNYLKCYRHRHYAFCRFPWTKALKRKPGTRLRSEEKRQKTESNRKNSGGLGRRKGRRISRIASLADVFFAAPIFFSSPSFPHSQCGTWS